MSLAPLNHRSSTGWAFVLCAGLGTRLAPLTNDRPKALVALNGETLLDRALKVCKEHGFGKFILNVHAHAPVLEDFVAQNLLRSKVMLSRELPEILDTGGGLKKAIHTMIQNRGKIPVEVLKQGLLVHNVDVVHRLDLTLFHAFHQKSVHHLTLAVSERGSSRYLVFKEGLLCGHWNLKSGLLRYVEPGREVEEIKGISSAEELLQRTGAKPLAFSGIYLVNASCFSDFLSPAVYPLVDWLLHLVSRGHTVGTWQHDPSLWLDVGTPDRLKVASEFLHHKASTGP